MHYLNMSAWNNDLFSTIKTLSNDTLAILAHNVISLSKHLGYIVNGNRILNDTWFTKTQITPSGSSCKITEALYFSILSLITSKLISNFDLQM